MAAVLSLALSPLQALAVDRFLPGCTLEVTASGKIDGQASDAPIVDVLRELSRITGMEVAGLSSEDPTRVSFRFDAVPVTEAVDRVLRNRNYTLLMRQSSDGPRVTRVTILGGPSRVSRRDVDNRRDDWAPVVPQAESSATIELEPRTVQERFAPGNDAAERQNAFEELTQSGTLDVDALFEIAEIDPDVEIRGRATEMLGLELVKNPALAERFATLLDGARQGSGGNASARLR